MNDRYTKVVLTVIAVALVGILLRGELRPPYAAGGITKVAICDASGEACLPLYNSMRGDAVGIRVFTQ
jgi:hypothetical protein